MTREERRFQIFCAHLAAGNDVAEASGLAAADLAEFERTATKEDPPYCGECGGETPCDGNCESGTHGDPPAPLFGVPVEVVRAYLDSESGSEYRRNHTALRDAIRAAESREVPGWLAALLGDRPKSDWAIIAARAALGIK